MLIGSRMPSGEPEISASIKGQGVSARNATHYRAGGTDGRGSRMSNAWLVDVCAEYGYRFTTRLHILLWGDRRGT